MRLSEIPVYKERTVNKVDFVFEGLLRILDKPKFSTTLNQPHLQDTLLQNGGDFFTTLPDTIYVIGHSMPAVET